MAITILKGFEYGKNTQFVFSTYLPYDFVDVIREGNKISIIQGNKYKLCGKQKAFTYSIPDGYKYAIYDRKKQEAIFVNNIKEILEYFLGKLSKDELNFLLDAYKKIKEKAKIRRIKTIISLLILHYFRYKYLFENINFVIKKFKEFCKEKGIRVKRKVILLYLSLKL